jgi:acyl-coenzyme A synthetase/AMP-(fatty) acid ligase
VNLLQDFFAQAEVRGGRTAIIAADGTRASYSDLVAQSAILSAAWRRKGVEAGDRVLLAMPLGIALYASLAALWRLGAVVVFPEPALGLKGLRHAVEVTKPKAFLAGGWFRALRLAWPALWSIPVLSPNDGAAGGDPMTEVAADHPALISFTSGSTGRPKTIVRSHGFLARQNACVAELLRPKRDDEVDLVAFPVFVLANLNLGVTSLLPSWNLRDHQSADAAAIARHAEAHRVTRALVPPAICEILARGPAPRLDAVFTGGGPVFPDLLERLTAQLPQTDIVAVYGSTEAEPIAHLHARDIGADDWQAMRGGAGLLAGHSVPQVRLQIREHEIVVTGDHVNKGYLDPADDASTKIAVDGTIWHRTGDAGLFDRGGRLWLLGRLDGRAGNLFPFGVEAAARFWRGVAQAALMEIDGQAILAIEGESGSQALWQREADQLGALRVVSVPAMPLDRRHRSKIDYGALRKVLSGA